MSKATVTTSFENSRLVIKSTADYILPAVLSSSAIVVVLIVIATIVVTLFTSHRIAGPLYRIEKDLEELVSGNLNKRFNLRKTDELKRITQSLNDMAEILKQDMSKIKNAFSTIETTADSEKAKGSLKEIKEILEKYKT